MDATSIASRIVFCLLLGVFMDGGIWKRKAVNVKNSSLERSSCGVVPDSVVDEVTPAYVRMKQ